jgi:hypothetical protein
LLFGAGGGFDTDFDAPGVVEGDAAAAGEGTEAGVESLGFLFGTAADVAGSPR